METVNHWNRKKARIILLIRMQQFLLELKRKLRVPLFVEVERIMISPGVPVIKTDP